jgi:toxin ParE1/3/4
VSVQVWRHPRAAEDLLDIWLFIARYSVAAADKFLDRIEERCRMLVAFPEIGAVREDIGPGVRVLTVDRYLVLYRARRDRVDIVRVLHGARDISDLL